MNKILSPLVKKKTVALSKQRTLPLIIEPVEEGIDLVDWIKENRNEFEKELNKYGGVLFRNFEIDSLQSFKRFIDCFDSAPIPYLFRSSPRHEIDERVKNIYTSTIYPKKESIILHNESSYSRSWGMKIAFCCLQPAEKGGETPLANSRRILKDIPNEIVEKFREKGVLYRRRLIKKQSMSWQEVFQTNDKEEVFRIARNNNIKCHFKSDDHLDVEWTQKAIHTHPYTGEETWFNHAYFFNKYARYEELGVEYNYMLPEEFIFTDSLYGDGTQISVNEYKAIKDAILKNKIQFKYKKGDIIFLDNMLMAHGRNPYEGDRVIATAILEPYTG